MNAQFIEGQWESGVGAVLTVTDPITGQPCWSDRGAAREQIDRAFAAARHAFEHWAATTLEQRIAYVHAFTEQLRTHRDALAQQISAETGKPLWESRSEVDTMIAKGPTSIEAHEQRRGPSEIDLQGARGATRYRPHGVVAVLGPFNLPGHLPNGHITPALLAGNTVVLKPSEQTPGVGAHMARLWEAAGLPKGVLNLVQGGREAGERIVTHRELDGLFFTGSFAAGRAINRALADEPGRILALEMGGNNPLVVDEVTDTAAAAYHAVLSAFITAGQRCTCARRLIVPHGQPGDRFIERLIDLSRTVRVGAPGDEPEPFMGPVVSREAAQRVLDAQQALLDAGGRSLLTMRRLERSEAMLTPGIVDVTAIADRADEEVFGPLLQLIRVNDFDAAVREANATRYGLAAALFSDDPQRFAEFDRRIRAGVVNWNRQTTGASGKLPFGGIGRSGNHRPSGYFAADYCAYPVASIEQPKLTMPAQPLPGITP